MIQEVPTIEELIKQVVSYLQKVGYSDTRITQYRSAWQKLINYMSKHEIKVYNASVADSFTYSLLDGRKYDCISQWEKDVIMCVNRLTEYLETGTVRFRRAKKFYELNGPIGKTMQDYLKTRREARISQETIDEISRALQSFLNYLIDNEICDVLEISKPILIDYTVFCNGYQTQYIRHRMLGILKGYLRYLYDIGSVSYDFSKALPRDKYTRQPKLPTTYSDTEIQRLLEVIDRGSPKGKRDYAMVLITARLGLRASDVCGLKFSSVIWEQNQIVLTMEKTRKRIELPLLTEVGEAIIDYLKYGRPQSELPFIFLHINHPYDRLNRSTLHSIICQYLRRAGISCGDKRKHGPHALRHSLAGILLEKKTPIPVISQVLGHTNTESTRYYLRIDINSLRQCTLDVPPVPLSFYQGGTVQ
jgi:integrase/recombinase XerD